MTSADSMLRKFLLPGRPAPMGVLAAALLTSGVTGVTGCASPSFTEPLKLTPPSVVVAPYDVSRGEVLFGVVPFRNETGVSQLDNLAFSDRIVAALEEVRGIRCLPVNRTLEAMRGLRLTQISTPGQARQLAQAMGVDGLVVGSLTAWDPYDPVIGLSMILQARPGSLNRTGAAPEAGLDPHQLSRMSTEPEVAAATHFGSDAPTNVLSENLDGKDQGVLVQVQKFAQGRHDPSAAMGWQRYVKSMDLYQQFAAHYAVEQLMESEKVRLGVTAPEPGGVSGGVSKPGNSKGP